MGAVTDRGWTYKDATPYEVLGVERDCTNDEIRAAWRKLTLVAHPDRGGTSALFVLTQEAFELLIYPVRQCDFDQRHRSRPPDKGSRGPVPLNRAFVTVSTRIVNSGVGTRFGWAPTFTLLDVGRPAAFRD